MAKPAAEELLTSTKIAEKFGFPQSKVKKTIEQLGIQPDVMKGKCGYYSPSAVEKIKSSIK